MMVRCGVVLSAAALVLASAAQAGPTEAMAFAIGMCSAQPDPQARLACYDQIAAKLRAGEPIGPQAGAAAPAPFYTPPPAPRSVQTPAPPPSAAVASQTPPVQSFGKPASTPAPRDSGATWYNPGSWFGGGSEEQTARATTGTPAEFGAESVRARQANQPSAPEPLDHITAKVTGVAFSANGRFTVTLDNGQTWKQLDGDIGTPQFNKRGQDVVTISRGFLGSYNLVVEGHTAMFKVRRLQ